MRRSKSMLGIAGVCVFSYATWFAAVASPQVEAWHLDGAHSSAQFSVSHLGISTVRGAFTKIGGDVNYSPSDLSKASLDITIDASSVDTRVAMRDNDLRSEHFLDVAKYPTITFKSKKVSSAGTGKLAITGDLTIHGVTKEITLDVTGPSAPIKNPMGPGQRMGASATTKIKRQDFGMTYLSGPVGDEVEIQIDVELVK
jgi:polyisoprenoid-binding protein YceI